MLAWDFRQGVAWDLNKCPQSFLEYMGLERSSSSCTLQCSHLSTNPAWRIRARPTMTERCTVHSHDTFVVADQRYDSRVKTDQERPCGCSDRPEKPTRSMHLDALEVQQERCVEVNCTVVMKSLTSLSSSSLFHEPSATRSGSPVDQAILLGLPVSDTLRGLMPMDCQPEHGCYTSPDAAHPPIVTTSNLGQSLSSQSTGREQHRSTGYYPQLDLPLQMRSDYNEYRNTGPDYGWVLPKPRFLSQVIILGTKVDYLRSSTDMNLLWHDQFSELFSVPYPGET